MNKSTIIIGGIIIALLAFFLFKTDGKTIVGSVAQTGEYQATTTYSKLGVPLFQPNAVISGSRGTLGSVIITGAVAGKMVFMDATSTTDISSTTIAVFPASAAAQTYTLDLRFYRGLIVETTTGLAPTSTITFRQ